MLENLRDRRIGRGFLLATLLAGSGCAPLPPESEEPHDENPAGQTQEKFKSSSRGVPIDPATGKIPPHVRSTLPEALAREIEEEAKVKLASPEKAKEVKPSLM